MLRDLVRKISNGIEQINYKGITIGLADERGEIASMYKGIAQNEVGIRTDILDNVPKWIAMYVVELKEFLQYMENVWRILS